MMKLNGQCMCGAVQYQMHGNIGPVVNCHCSKCRKWHNAAFRTRVAVAKKNFTWLAGEAFVQNFLSSGNIMKTFCKRCGSILISYKTDNPDVLGLAIGTIEGEDAAKLKPQMHIFVGSKAPWYDITDDLPQYDTWPPGGPEAVRCCEK